MEEKRKLEIQKEAQEILKKFGKMLENAPVVKIKNEKVISSREENGNVRDDHFKKRILENAPESDEDCVIAEKASW